MQHRTRRLVIVFGASLVAALGVLAACTDNGVTPLPGQPDGNPGKNNSKSDAKSDDKTPEEEEEEDGSTIPEAGADCSAATKVRSNKGVFCFGGEGAVDAGGYCDPAENKVCCADEKDSQGNFVPAKCAAATVSSEGYNEGACGQTPDAGGREWHCTQASHCPNQGEVCCVVKGWGGLPQAQPDTKDFPGCGNFFNSSSDYFVGGSRCRADSCESGELKLCAKDDDCSGGEKCHYFKLANRHAGVCR